MRKIISLLCAMTITTTSVATVVSCAAGGSPGDPVPANYYEDNNNINVDQTNAKSFYTKNDDEDNFVLNQSIPTSVIMPLTFGLNLNRDSNKTRNSAVWKDSQYDNALLKKKDDLINNPQITPEQKNEWRSFFDNYSTTEDNYYSQVALLNRDNKDLQSLDNKMFVKVPNLERSIDKKYTFVNGDKLAWKKQTLNTFLPVQSALDYLNYNYNLQSTLSDETQNLQNYEYAYVSLPNLVITYEFDKKYTYKVKVNNLVALLAYAAVKNPNDEHKNQYARQWYLLGYSFFDFKGRQDDDNHIYNVPWDQADRFQLAIGKMTTGGNRILSKDEAKSNVDKSKFPVNTKYAFADLEWEIIPTSINEYKS